MHLAVPLLPWCPLLLIPLQSCCTTRRSYLQLRNRKCVCFWSDKLTTATSLRDMWITVDRLLGRGRRACGGVSVDDLSAFFAEKVERIRSTTSGSPTPAFRPAPPDITFTEYLVSIPCWSTTACPLQRQVLCIH